MAEARAVFLQVTVDQVVDDQKIVKQYVKKLSEPFWQVPLVGDQVLVRAPTARTIPQGVDEQGVVSVIYVWEEGDVRLQFQVLRRMWSPEGVTLICQFFPEQPPERAVELQEALLGAEFKPLPQ